MSESSFPFQGGTTVATPPPPMLPLEEVPEGNRSKLLLVAGLAVLVVLGVVGYFLFIAGGGAEDPAPAARPKTVAPASAGDQPAAEQPAAKKINAKSFGRDPFKPLIVEQPATSGSTGTTAAGTTTQSNTSTSQTAADSTTVPVATTSHSFRVVSVAPDNSTVTVNVDGKRYNNLHAGEVFAKYFKVVLISGTTNAFQYGEEKFNVLGTKRLTIA